MTSKYWTGIVIAILAIFGVGLLVARGIRAGKALVESTFPAPLGLVNANFRVDGDQLGDVQRMRFLRSAPGQVDSAVLNVKLNGAAVSLEAPGCALRVVNAQPFGSSTRFACTSPADSARLGLTRFGHVELSDGHQVALYIPGDVAAGVRKNAYRGTGSSDSGDVDIDVANGHFSFTINGKELFSASGDSTGGSLVIRDPKTGRTIVEINGDSGSVRVTDANGRTRVNIHGANTRVSVPGKGARADSGTTP